MASETLALDVYGTLINPHAIAARLRVYLGNQADAFSQLWRTKQLEFSFRRGLMGVYEDFSVVTRDALTYTDAALDAKLTEDAQAILLADYTRLDAYADVPQALTSLREQGRSLYAFSNGHPNDLETLLANANILELLDGVVSVHDVQSFKPNPKVYQHFNKTTGTKRSQTRLVSSNAFDITGAQAVGWNVAWVRRDPNIVYDSWGELPETIVPSLSSL